MSGGELADFFLGAGGPLLLGAGSLLFAMLAWLSSRRAVRVSEEQLLLAREQAEMRPGLEVACYVDPQDRNKRTRGGFSLPPRKGRSTLVVEVSNGDGRAAATHVHGWIGMEATKLGPYEPPPPPPREEDTSVWPPRMALSVPHTPPGTPERSSWGSIFRKDQEPEDGFYQAQVYDDGTLLPGTVRTFEIGVGIRAEGTAKIRYRVVCAEGARAEGTVEVEVGAAPG